MNYLSLRPQGEEKLNSYVIVQAVKMSYKLHLVFFFYVVTLGKRNLKPTKYRLSCIVKFVNFCSSKLTIFYDLKLLISYRIVQTFILFSVTLLRLLLFRPESSCLQFVAIAAHYEQNIFIHSYSFLLLSWKMFNSSISKQQFV